MGRLPRLGAPITLTHSAPPGSAPPRYASKIIKAGALLPDTRALFASWDVGLPVRANLDLIRSRNVLGKASRARVDDVLAIFRQRYLGDPATAVALATLVQADVPRQILDPIFSFYSARSDRLLRDVVIDVLAPRYWRGAADVSTEEVEAFLTDQVRQGRTAGRWSEPTTRRIAQGLLATLRDFGVLGGSARKRVTPVYLPTSAFAFIAFVLDRKIRSGDRLLNSPEWGLFFLQPHLVERFFVEAQQRCLLTYHAAGPIIRIDFPASTIQEYARALAQRTD